jgi:tight adherence protein B
MGANSGALLGSVAFGLAVAVASFTGRPYFNAALDAVQRNIAEKLHRLRMSTKNLRKRIVVWLIVVGCVFLGIWLFLDSFVFALLALAILTAAPWYFLRRMAAQHRERLENQLADAMVTLANAVRAGLSLAQAMEILATQCPRPINAEFHQITAEYKLGKPLDRTLIEAKERLRSENFALFAAAILASHESGGKLNQTVERIAQSVLELQRLERKITAETAQARKSAVYMALAPGLILTVYYFVDPVNTTMLFTQIPGQIILSLAVVLNIVAYVWARVILNPDI